MANEFGHVTVGVELTQPEYESVLAHRFDGQATGDIMYASSNVQLSRLGITASRILVSSVGGLPEWNNTLPAFTLGDTVTLNGQVFDAGLGSATITTTQSWNGLWIILTNDTDDAARLTIDRISTTPLDNDYLFDLMVRGRSDGLPQNIITYGMFRVRIEDMTKGAEKGYMEWYTARIDGTNTLGMALSSIGGLGVDADIGTADDPVALFDDYDDALMLKQGIQERNHDLLVKLGVFTRKATGSGYMMNIQPMTRLLAGGIYQNRAMLENTIEIFSAKIERLENELAEIKGV